MSEPESQVAPAWIEKGQLHLQCLDYEEALDCFRQALVLDPGLPEGWLQYAGVLEKLNCYGAAIAANSNAQKLYANPVLKPEPPALEQNSAIAAALSLQRSTADYWLQRGHALCDLGDYAQAITSYDKALELRPDGQAWFGRGNMAAALGRFEEAVASYDRAIELQSNDYQAWNNRGYALHKLAQYEAAIISYDQTLALKPDCYPAWNNRGYAMCYLGRDEAALPYFDKALALNHSYAEAWNNRANALKNLGRFEEAIVSYSEALVIKPDFEEAQAGRKLAQLVLQPDIRPGIISIGKQADDQALEPETQIDWVERGKTLFEQGRYEEAITHYDEALELNPANPEAWFHCGITLMALQRYGDAIISYDKALELKPDYCEAWYSRGIALNDFGRYEDAIASYEQALRYQPDFYAAWVNQGSVLNKLSRYTAAVSCYDQAIRLKPEDSEAWLRRGIAHAHLGHSEAAITSYDQALSLTQNQHWQAWENRGLTVLRSQGYQAALLTWQSGIEALHPAHSTYAYGCGQLHYRKGKTQYAEGRKQPNPFADWSAAQDSYLKALGFISIDNFPVEHLTLLEALLTVRSQLLSPAENLGLLQDATAKLQRVVQNPTLPVSQKLALERQFVGFSQLWVDALAPQDPIQALELAEASRRCLERLHQDKGHPTYAQIQTLLSPRTAAIYWHISPAALTTFILKHNQPPQVFQPNAPLLEAYPPAAHQLQELEAWFKLWQQDYLSYCNSDPDKSAQTPWRQRLEWMLFARLRTILKTQQICFDYLQDIDHLILLPHRSLDLIPLHALFLEQYTVTYLPSAQLGLALRPHPNPPIQQLLSIEAPVTQGALADNGSSTLCTQLTAALVTQLYSPCTQSISGAAATKASVVGALNGMSGCLHFSGYSCHNPKEPLQSALVLAGKDLLTLKDLGQLDLQSYGLICLSACEPHITSTPALTDEYIGLSSGFLVAGAAQVISTLWPVDESGVLLMVELHRRLRKASLDPALALAQTQQWLRTVTYAELNQWYQHRAAELATVDSRGRLVARLQDLARIAGTSANHSGQHAPYANPFYWAGFKVTGKV